MSVVHEPKRQENRDKTTFEFTLILGGISGISEDLENAIYGGKCDDALLGLQDGEVFLDFSRESETLINAIMTAIIDVERAGVNGLKVLEVRPPDKLTIDMVNSFLELRNHLAHHKEGFESEMWQLLSKAGLT